MQYSTKEPDGHMRLKPSGSMAWQGLSNLNILMMLQSTSMLLGNL